VKLPTTMQLLKRISRLRPHARRGRLAQMLLPVIAAITAIALLAHVPGVAAMLQAHPASAETAPAPLPSTPLTPTPLPPTRLLALPDRNVSNGTHQLVVRFGAPVSAGSPTPTLTPADAGTWKVRGEDEVFTPASTLTPCSSYTLTVWAQSVSTGHAPLGRRRTLNLHVACPPLAGLQQALARLGYLDARLHTRYIFHEPAGALTRGEAAGYAYSPPRGALEPAAADAPPVRMGRLDATTRGALTVYQERRGLRVTGEPDEGTWERLLYDLAHYRRDPQPYTWVTVTMSIPETLKVHRGSRVVLSTPVNTGVRGAETQRGIFPIYLRYISTSMSGTEVNGEKYDVPDVPWVNYFNGGDAVHGYPRASYGFPQSNGCVELPIGAAHTVFGMLAIGDIVWVR